MQSTAVTATPLIGVPQNVRAAVSEDAAGTAGSRQQVVLSWDAVTGAASYKVYQDSAALSTLPATLTATTYTLSGLTDGQSYTFEVAAVDGSNQEADKSTAVVTCNFADADGDGLTEICTLDHLQQINTNATTRGGSYELVRNLDFSSQHSYAPGSDNWTNKTWRPVNTSTAAAGSTVVAHGSGQNAGWTPIGPSNVSTFTGSFNGRGYRIDNLYVRRTTAGLFGQIDSSGVVRNIHVDGNIYGTAGVDQIGGMAGYNLGLIIASSSSGTVDLLTGSNEYAGGLVGGNTNRGTVAASYSTADVNGGIGVNGVGGLVGTVNANTVIVASYATGAADGGAGADIVAGLVSLMRGGTILASYATGAVSNYGDTFGDSVAYRFTGSATVTESYGYGTLDMDGDGTFDSNGNPNGEKALTAGAVADGSTNAGLSWSTDVWDFGTSSQSPRLKWVTGYDKDDGTFSCNAALLPAGQSCGGIIPGQPARE